MAFIFELKTFLRLMMFSMTVGLVQGCATHASSQAPLSQNIDIVDIQRLEFAQASIEQVSQDWQLATNAVDKTCIILFGDQREWILNCSKPLVSDTTVVSEFKGKPVYFTAKSLSVPTTTVPYTQIATSVVAQASILTPYQQKVKNLDLPPVILIQKLEDLVTHHPGFPKDSTKTEELLSIYTHEFFHILQFTNPHVSQYMDTQLEKNCFSDQTELSKFYAQNLSYQESIKKEYELLSSYLKDEKSYSRKSAKRVLKKWLSLYNQRIQKHSDLFSAVSKCSNLKDVDSFWTFVEGTARYVESQFLLDPKLHALSDVLRSDAQFGHFDSIHGETYSNLPPANKNLGSKYYYSIGAHLSFILDIIDKKSWKKEAFVNSNWLIGAVKSAVK